MDGEYYRISAAALRRRGLVTISGRGESWTAEVTTAGRGYLAEVDGPNPPKPRHPNVLVTEQLVAEVIEAGGSLRVPRSDYRYPDRVDYEHRARLAERHGKVPAGKQLRVKRVSSDEIQIDLIDAPANLGSPEQPVPVPDVVRRYHPVVKAFKDRSDRHEVSRAALPRALRILQGLVVEAESRGYAIELAPEPDNGQRYGSYARWTGPNDGHLVIGVRGYSTRLRVGEEGVPSRANWERQNPRYSSSVGKWIVSPLSEYEAKATGRLVVELVPSYGHGGRTHRWADRKSGPLEDKLPEVLYGIELRAADHEERKREAVRAADERQRDRETAVERAQERHAHQRQVDALTEQVSQWRKARGIRSYCDFAASAHPNDDETVEWIRWARAHADSIDPVRVAPRGPKPGKPASLQELEPYLGGLKPLDRMGLVSSEGRYDAR
jgi:hypothetical protein